MLENVLFDFDGVIIDSEKVYLETIKEFLNKKNIIFEKSELIYLIGKPGIEISTDLVDKYLLNITTIELDKKLDIALERKLYQMKIPVFEGIKKLMEEIISSEELKITIVSTSDEMFIKTALLDCGLDQYVSLIVTPKNVDNPKPAPDIYLKTIDMLSLQPDEVIVFEDSYNGILSAKRAELKVIAFKGSEVEQNTNMADYVIYNYSEVSVNKLKKILSE